MRKCTGRKCPMQYDKVDPATCKAVGYCEFATKPTTNGDLVRSMSDKELAQFIRDQIIDRNIGIPTETWLEWLQQEVGCL